MPARLPLAAALVCVSTAAALAQQGLDEEQGLGGTTEASASSMGQLLDDGYEIRATAQKEKSAYACEFVNVSATRCRPIN